MWIICCEHTFSLLRFVRYQRECLCVWWVGGLVVWLNMEVDRSGGDLQSLPWYGEKCSSAEIHSSSEREQCGFHDYQILLHACGFGPAEPQWAERVKEYTSVVLNWPDQTQIWTLVENEQFCQCQDESGWWARSPVLALHYVCVFVCVSCGVGVLGPVCMSVLLMQSKQMDQLKLTSVHSALFACKLLQNLKSLENVSLCFM